MDRSSRCVLSTLRLNETDERVENPLQIHSSLPPSLFLPTVHTHLQLQNLPMRSHPIKKKTIKTKHKPIKLDSLLRFLLAVHFMMIETIKCGAQVLAAVWKSTPSVFGRGEVLG